MIEKVQNKLTNWKQNQLSFAGKVTRAKAIIETLLTYIMMTNAVPKARIKEIQKYHRDFIWGDSEDKRHISTVI